MGFEQKYQEGPASLVVSEAGGVATLTASVSASAGGGEVAGDLSASASVSIQVKAASLIDAGLQMAESAYPSVAPLIAGLKSAIDAEMAKA